MSLKYTFTFISFLPRSWCLFAVNVRNMQTLVAIALVDPMHRYLLIQKSEPVDISVTFVIESITTFGKAKMHVIEGKGDPLSCTLGVHINLNNDKHDLISQYQRLQKCSLSKLKPVLSEAHREQLPE